MSTDILRTLLQEKFGFPDFREGQREIIDAIVEGQDVVVVMPTGGGKSLCFQLPALSLPGVTLVVSPLIALMTDQVQALHERGIAAACLNSSMGEAEQSRCLQQARNGELKLIYVAPERFRSRRFMQTLKHMEVSLFAVDEAHCLSQWGHDFRPDYMRLGEAVAAVRRPPVAAFTATATKDVREDIIQTLGLREPATFFSGVDRPNLTLKVNFAAKQAEKIDAIRNRMRKKPNESGIVYASTRKNVDKVFIKLSEYGLPVSRYHAGMADDARGEAQRAFMAGEVPLIVATNAFGMGVDKSDIRYVFHYDFPGSIEAYYQEVGRAGRDGKASDCILLFNYADLRIQEFFLEGSNPPKSLIRRVYRLLEKMTGETVELTVGDIASMLEGVDNEMAVSTVLKTLDRYGVIHRGNASGQGFVQMDDPAEEVAVKLKRAPAQRAVVLALASMHRDTLAMGVTVDLAALAKECGRDRENVQRALLELQRAKLVDYIPPFRGRTTEVGDMGSLDLINWDRLDEKAQRDHDRVKSVVRFAYARECRKAYLREYFGFGRSQEGSCGSCDICLGEIPVAQRTLGSLKAPGEGPYRAIEGDELEVVRKCLACAARLKGNYGRHRMAQVLRGSKDREILNAKLDQLSTYGLLSRFSQAKLLELIDALVREGLLKLNRVGSAGRTQSVVKLTSEGWEVMAGRQDLEAGLPVLGRMPAKAAKALGSGGGAWQEEVGDGGLFEMLRTWRRRLAEEKQVPVYHILHDRALKGVCRYLPSDESELIQVKGLGPKKIERYGDQLLSMVLEFKRLAEAG